jgi:hypothetical protein
MSQVWTLAPIAVTHPSLLTKSELNAFERDILESKNVTETEASYLFARMPRFLFLGNVLRISFCQQVAVSPSFLCIFVSL